MQVKVNAVRLLFRIQMYSEECGASAASAHQQGMSCQVHADKTRRSI